MRRILLSIGLVLAASAGSNAIAAGPSPYVGQESREIKALSTQDIDDLVNGRGMGLAKAAELNGYPGPMHVLEMSLDFKLTPDQIRVVTGFKNKMSDAARSLGAEILARERQLDQQFVAGTTNESQLIKETEAIGALYGKLRSVHLVAHLRTQGVLTAEQISLYNQRRGYGPDPAPQTPEHSMHGK